MTIEQLKKLMKDLGASEETTSDGFTFIELDSKNLKCPQASKSCHTTGWPKGKPQATSDDK